MLLYLATPYTTNDPVLLQSRFEKACAAAGQFMNRGYEVFSPVAHSHPVADHLDEALRLNHEFWLRQDFAVLKHCDVMVIYALPGWDKSYGIGEEVKIAHANGIPVYVIGEGMFALLDQMIADDANASNENYDDYLDIEDAAGDAVMASIREQQGYSE